MNSQPYVPVEFADFSVYNASLENREWFSSKGDLANSRASEKEVSRSPTTSSITSGYFSHSASNATLSDMVVPTSDSSDQLAVQTKDPDCSEHSALSLVPDSRLPSNRELPEGEGGLGKEKASAAPPKEHSALANASAPERNSRLLARAGSCSEPDACPSRNGQAARELCPREVTVEHTTDILEDHSFTEFMGASDGRDLDGLTDASAAEASSGRILPNKTDSKSVPEGPRDTGQLNSKLENDQVIHPRLWGPVLSVSGRIVHSSPGAFAAGPGGRVILIFTTGKTPPGEQALNLSSSLSVAEQVCFGNQSETMIYIGPVDFFFLTSIWVGVKVSIRVDKDQLISYSFPEVFSYWRFQSHLVASTLFHQICDSFDYYMIYYCIYH